MTELEILLFQVITELDEYRNAWDAADALRDVVNLHRECLPDPCPTIKAVSRHLLGE